MDKNIIPENLSGKTIVAMSGGVDSSVAAYLLNKQGHDTVGISMQVWDYRQNGGCESKATCCSPDDFTDARMVAHKIGIPYYVFDFEESFREKVINNFVDTYKRGLTPNPCIDCNNKVKFRELRDRASRFKCSAVATGHFARITKDEDGYNLLRGADPLKDQSYFLYGLTQQDLSETIFPVGEMHKTEVREIAREIGLVTADKSESQDICFVQGKLKDFIVKIGGKNPAGNIIDTNGIILGTHDGIHQYTVGQRKGLGVSSDTPLYVTEINPQTNEVTLGKKHELEQGAFQANQLNFIDPKILSDLKTNNSAEFTSIAQMRYRHQGVKTKVEVSKKDGQLNAVVKFINDWSPVSPGQAVVFYDLDNNRVLGGGRITKNSAE